MTRIDAQIACHRKGTYEQKVVRSRMIAFDKRDAKIMADMARPVFKALSLSARCGFLTER